LENDSLILMLFMTAPAVLLLLFDFVIWTLLVLAHLLLFDFCLWNSLALRLRGGEMLLHMCCEAQDDKLLPKVGEQVPNHWWPQKTQSKSEIY